LNKRMVGRAGALVAAFLIVLSSAPAVFADGEIGDVGDTDSIGNINDVDNHATLLVDYVHDCPAGVSGCDIQVRFANKCPEPWCDYFTYQGWKSVGAPVNGVGKVSADCTGSGNNENLWIAEYRIRWWATSTIKVTLTGETESYINLSAGTSYRTIAEAAIKAGASGATKGSTTISTVTASNQTWTTGAVATSRGVVLNTCQ
jgi:hypothetical protein